MWFGWRIGRHFVSGSEYAKVAMGTLREHSRAARRVTKPCCQRLHGGQGGTRREVLQSIHDGHGGTPREVPRAYLGSLESTRPGTGIPNVYRSCIGAGRMGPCEVGGWRNSRIARAMRSSQHLLGTIWPRMSPKGTDKGRQGTSCISDAWGVKNSAARAVRTATAVCIHDLGLKTVRDQRDSPSGA